MTTIDLDQLSAYSQEELHDAADKIFQELGPSQAWETLTKASEAIKREGGGLVIAARFNPDNPFHMDIMGYQPDFRNYEEYRTANVLLMVRAWMMIEQLLIYGSGQIGLGPHGARELFVATIRKMREDEEASKSDPDDDTPGSYMFPQK